MKTYEINKDFGRDENWNLWCYSEFNWERFGIGFEATFDSGVGISINLPFIVLYAGVIKYTPEDE